ncbi:MAG: hypothetical protein HYW80_00935, partial [Parcubacteria group bacterium]|nr:hypothetical protein [Parcubacteria group bacterium]
LLAQVVAFQEGGKITLQEVEEILGTANFAKLRKLFEKLAAGDAAGAVEFLNEAQEQGYEMTELSRATLSSLRKVMILQIEPSLDKLFSHELTDEELEALKQLAASFDQAKLRELVKGFMNAQYLIRRAVIPTLPLELVILETFTKK